VYKKVLKYYHKSYLKPSSRISTLVRFGFDKDDVHNQHKWRSLITGNCSTLSQRGSGNEGVILYELCSRDVKR